MKLGSAWKDRHKEKRLIKTYIRKKITFKKLRYQVGKMK